jgi:hypothetical protein
MTLDVILQLERNVQDFNNERASWPDRSRALWLSELLELAEMAGVRLTVDSSGFLHGDNSRPSGDKNCHRFPR